MMVSPTEDIAIVWVPAYDTAQCGQCLESLAPKFGFALAEQDDNFRLYRNSPAE